MASEIEEIIIDDEDASIYMNKSTHCLHKTFELIK